MAQPAGQNPPESAQYREFDHKVIIPAHRSQGFQRFVNTNSSSA
jgi:hypothetical protein